MTPSRRGLSHKAQPWDEAQVGPDRAATPRLHPRRAAHRHARAPRHHLGLRGLETAAGARSPRATCRASSRPSTRPRRAPPRSLRTPSPQNCLPRSPRPTSPSRLPRPDGGHRGHASRRAHAPAHRHLGDRVRDEDPCEVSARAGERGVGPAAGSHVRQEFLRTYAEALGLDGKLLIEEYKLRHELLFRTSRSSRSAPRARPATSGGAGAARGEPRLGRPRRRVRDRRRALLPRQQRGRRRQRRGKHDPVRDDLDHDDPRPDVDDPQVLDDLGPLARRAPRRAGRGPPRPPAHRPDRTGLRLPPSRADGGIINGRILQAGSRQPTYRSKRFRLLLGNSEAHLRSTVRRARWPRRAGSSATRSRRRAGVRPLWAGNRPNCGA